MGLSSERNHSTSAKPYNDGLQEKTVFATSKSINGFILPYVLAQCTKKRTKVTNTSTGSQFTLEPAA